MAKKKGLIGLATAFAASPQGRKLIQQGKTYAQKPENRAKAEKLIDQVRNRTKGGGTKPAPGPTTGPTTVRGETIDPTRPETPPR